MDVCGVCKLKRSYERCLFPHPVVFRACNTHLDLLLSEHSVGLPVGASSLLCYHHPGSSASTAVALCVGSYR